MESNVTMQSITTFVRFIPYNYILKPKEFLNNLKYSQSPAKHSDIYENDEVRKKREIT